MTQTIVRCRLGEKSCGKCRYFRLYGDRYANGIECNSPFKPDVRRPEPKLK